MTVVELFLNPSVVFLLLLIQAFHVQGVDAAGAGDVSVLGCWIVFVLFKLLIVLHWKILKLIIQTANVRAALVVSLGEREAVNNCCCLILVGNSTLTCNDSSPWSLFSFPLLFFLFFLLLFVASDAIIFLSLFSLHRPLPLFWSLSFLWRASVLDLDTTRAANKTLKLKKF